MGIRLTEDSTSLAIFEALVEYSNVDTALAFFKRYEGRRVYFSTSKKIKERAIHACIRKEYATGNYKYTELARKYGKPTERVWRLINNPSKHSVRAVEMYNYLCDLLGDEKALKMYDRFHGNDVVVCRISSLLLEERDIRMCKLYKKGVSVDELAMMFKLGVRQVYKVLKLYRSDIGYKVNQQQKANKKGARNSNRISSR